MHTSLATLLLQTTALLASTAAGAPTCRNVTIPVTISAHNVQVPSTLTFSSIVSFVSLGLAQLVNAPIKGTYNIFASYCEPEVQIKGHNTTLQLLVHGSERTHAYWNGYAFNNVPYHGANYSWVQRASLQGYPTLAIDRLGNGLSDHPDPTTVVQLPAQVEVTHAIIQSVQAGFLKRSFSEIIYVGHSLGSVLGQVFNAQYPNDVNRTILTGWAAINVKELLTGSVANSTEAAALAKPAVYGNLTSGYITAINGTYASQQTYYGYATALAGRYYDPAIPELAFANQGTSTTGETYTEVFSITPATEYKGRLFVLTGQHDAFFCGQYSSADCGQGPWGTVAQSISDYPAAKSFDYYVPANTGHEWNFHYTQQESFDEVFTWLNSTN